MAAAGLAVGAIMFVLSPSASAATETETFEYTGAAQTWIVPAGVSEVTFDLYGAQGGQFLGSGTPGLGGRATATIAVSSFDSIQVNVGGQGGSSTSGFNGGGFGAAGGGGATDIRVGGTGLDARVLVAGGGGGAELFSCSGGSGGDGGGLVGDPGAGTGCGNPAETPGGGGTQSEGGSASAPATPGSFGVGGTAGGGGNVGGGGGGWYGGGGGLSGPGGGGGSGHGPPGATFETGVRSGNGLVAVSYERNPLPMTTITSGPEGVTSNTSPRFSFQSDQAASTFDCSLDGAAFGSCDSPKGYTGVAPGTHTFEVRATNAQLTTGPPDLREFTVDTSTTGSASAKKNQRQSQSKVVVKLKVASDERLKAKARGKIKLGRKAFKLSPQTVDLAGGASQTLKLKPKKDADRLFRGLANGQTAKAKLQVKFTDSAGNTAVDKLQVKLTG